MAQNKIKLGTMLTTSEAKKIYEATAHNINQEADFCVQLAEQYDITEECLTYEQWNNIDYQIVKGQHRVFKNEKGNYFTRSQVKRKDWGVFNEVTLNMSELAHHFNEYLSTYHYIDPYIIPEQSPTFEDIRIAVGVFLTHEEYDKGADEPDLDTAIQKTLLQTNVITAILCYATSDFDDKDLKIKPFPEDDYKNNLEEFTEYKELAKFIWDLCQYLHRQERKEAIEAQKKNPKQQPQQTADTAHAPTLEAEPKEPTADVSNVAGNAGNTETLEAIKPTEPETAHVQPTINETYRRYLFAKQQYPDNIVLYRVGDFYEIFNDDALLAANILDLTLTGRNVGLDERVPMVGIPYYASDIYIKKLFDNGHKVAVCDPIEENNAVYIHNYEEQEDFEVYNAEDNQTELTTPPVPLATQVAENPVLEEVQADDPFLTEDVDLPIVEEYAEQLDLFNIPKNPTTAEELTIEAVPEAKLEEVPETSEPLEKAEPQTDIAETFGGMKTRYRQNVEAIKLLRQLELEKRNPDLTERQILENYAGWGGISYAFENRENWESEYKELQELLTTDEYRAAESSTLTSFYTANGITTGIFEALKKFGVKGNNEILEPSMGIGAFFRTMPEEMKQDSNIHGVELDSLTGRIAAKLYPNYDIQVCGLEDTNFKNNSMDVVIGNVPFGNFGVSDKSYNRYNFKIHDYFLCKGIDKLRNGGIMAVITSASTLNSTNITARRYLANRATLLGAIRLPNVAFKSANTDVTTDIIFLQKTSMPQNNPDWINVDKDDFGHNLNRYFKEHPEMVIGEIKERTARNGKISYVDGDVSTLANSIVEVVDKYLPENVFEPDQNEGRKNQGLENIITIPNSLQDVPNLCLTEYKGHIFQRSNDQLIQIDLPNRPKNVKERVIGLINLRLEIRDMLKKQRENCSDEELQAVQKKLSDDYDTFVKNFGYVVDNLKYFKDDGDVSLLSALETVEKRYVLTEDMDEKAIEAETPDSDDEAADHGATQEIRTVNKSDFFTTRTIKTATPITYTSDVKEALKISRNLYGEVNIKCIEDLTRKDFDTVLEELGTEIYRDPTLADDKDKYTGYVIAEEYLSGDVKTKLEQAQYAVDFGRDYTQNVEALKAVQPTEIKAEEITAHLGSSWIDSEYYRQFIIYMMKQKRYFDLYDEDNEIYVGYSPITKDWSIILDNSGYNLKNTSISTQQYGIYQQGNDGKYKKLTFFDLMEMSMNSKTAMVYDYFEDNKGIQWRELNQALTAQAQDKQRLIEEEFAKWIFALNIPNPEQRDIDRRNDLVKTYNDKFNRIRLTKYDGSYLTFDGMNPSIELRQHQQNVIERALTGNNLLIDHQVGAGKTYAMIATGMKMKQLGLCTKPMFVVPNSIIEQWVSDFRYVYPEAKILVADKDSLNKENRKRFIAKCAMGTWDSIIITQSAFDRIAVTKERKIKKIQENISIVRAYLKEYNEKQNKGEVDRITIKKLNSALKKYETELKFLMESTEREDIIPFEQLGVDQLFIDEAHKYKNLQVFTLMNNVAGISQAASQRASYLTMKIDYLRELHGGEDKGVIFATGTPISNSMTEMYVMNTYLAHNTMEEMGLKTFDAWARDFCEKKVGIELKPDGQGFQTKTRISVFRNFPELLNIYMSYTDRQHSLDLPVPEAERENIIIEPTEQVKKCTKEIAERADKIHRGGVEPFKDNMLKITSDGRKLAIDTRLYDPENGYDEENNKLNTCARKVYEIYKDTTPNKSTQLIMCDQSTPKPGMNFANYNSEENFNVYFELKKKLIELGIKPNEIALIQQYDKEEEKKALFDSIRSGDVRVLIGSTEKCGTGVNIQERLIALHHLDAPWRPADLEQREGRIIRQGNTNPKVYIYTYITKETMDAFFFQTLEQKQKYIGQVQNGDITTRNVEDINDPVEMNYALVKAISAVNPIFREQHEVQIKLQQLNEQLRAYTANKRQMQDNVNINYPNRLKRNKEQLEKLRKDLKILNENKQDVFTIELYNSQTQSWRTYTKESNETATAFKTAMQNVKDEEVFARYRGFNIIRTYYVPKSSERSITIERNTRNELGLRTTSIEKGIDTGTLTRIKNVLNNKFDDEKEIEQNIKMLEENLATETELLKEPWDKQEEYDQTTQRLAEINRELNLGIDSKPDQIIDDTSVDSDTYHRSLIGLLKDKTNPEQTETKEQKPMANIFSRILRNNKQNENTNENTEEPYCVCDIIDRGHSVYPDYIKRKYQIFICNNNGSTKLSHNYEIHDENELKKALNELEERALSEKKKLVKVDDHHTLATISMQRALQKASDYKINKEENQEEKYTKETLDGHKVIKTIPFTYRTDTDNKRVNYSRTILRLNSGYNQDKYQIVDDYNTKDGMWGFSSTSYIYDTLQQAENKIDKKLILHNFIDEHIENYIVEQVENGEQSFSKTNLDEKIKDIFKWLYNYNYDDPKYPDEDLTKYTTTSIDKGKDNESEIMLKDIISAIQKYNHYYIFRTHEDIREDFRKIEHPVLSQEQFNKWYERFSTEYFKNHINKRYEQYNSYFNHLHNAIELNNEIHDNIDETYIKKDFVNKIVDKYGKDEINYLLANTIQLSKSNGFTIKNRNWADNFDITEPKDLRKEIIISVEPILLDRIIDNVREVELNEIMENEYYEEPDYRFETAQGFIVESKTKDSDNRNIAILHRETNEIEDYIVAANYNIVNGTWGQGFYGYKSMQEAVDFRNEKYGLTDKELVELLKNHEPYSIKKNKDNNYEIYMIANDGGIRKIGIKNHDTLKHTIAEFYDKLETFDYYNGKIFQEVSENELIKLSKIRQQIREQNPELKHLPQNFAKQIILAAAREYVHEEANNVDEGLDSYDYFLSCETEELDIILQKEKQPELEQMIPYFDSFLNTYSGRIHSFEKEISQSNAKKGIIQYVKDEDIKRILVSEFMKQQKIDYEEELKNYLDEQIDKEPKKDGNNTNFHRAMPSEIEAETQKPTAVVKNVAGNAGNAKTQAASNGNSKWLQVVIPKSAVVARSDKNAKIAFPQNSELSNSAFWVSQNFLKNKSETEINLILPKDFKIKVYTGSQAASEQTAQDVAAILKDGTWAERKMYHTQAEQKAQAKPEAKPEAAPAPVVDNTKKRNLSAQRLEFLAKVLKLMESGNTEWIKQWGKRQPYNPKTKTEYSGINNLFLTIASMERGYNDPRFYTFSQIESMGLKLKKGSKSVPIEYYTIMDKQTKKPFNEKDLVGLTEEEQDDYRKKNLYPLYKYYNVFNGSCVDGLKPYVQPKIDEAARNERCEKIIANAPTNIVYGGNSAYYRLSNDTVYLPDRADFRSLEGFYSTAFHEMAHSTGHESRLNRLQDSNKQSYAQEELVAEFASIFMEQKLHVELSNDQLKNHAAYLQAWATNIKQDPNMLFTAIKEAEKAEKFLLNLENVNDKKATSASKKAALSVEME